MARSSHRLIGHLSAVATLAAAAEAEAVAVAGLAGGSGWTWVACGAAGGMQGSGGSLTAVASASVRLVTDQQHESAQHELHILADEQAVMMYRDKADVTYSHCLLDDNLLGVGIVGFGFA